MAEYKIQNNITNTDDNILKKIITKKMEIIINNHIYKNLLKSNYSK